MTLVYKDAFAYNGADLAILMPELEKNFGPFSCQSCGSVVIPCKAYDNVKGNTDSVFNCAICCDTWVTSLRLISSPSECGWWLKMYFSKLMSNGSHQVSGQETVWISKKRLALTGLA